VVVNEDVPQGASSGLPGRASSYASWGRYPQTLQRIETVSWRDQLLRPGVLTPGSLPYGRGRSYGDVCLNGGGKLLDLSGLERVVFFDPQRGVLRAEGGITLRRILEIIVPLGWFLPVTPGTSLVTLGGAIANDVHGKNHHRAGTFGRHVLGIELLRPEGLLNISPSSDADLFNATIGGIGLTGIILSATIQLIPISTAGILGESIKFESLDEFFSISSESDKGFEYTVAWLDCLWSGGFRGHFMRGNHRTERAWQDAQPWSPRWELAGVPVNVPSRFVKSFGMKCFNFAYYNKQRARVTQIDQSFEPFFYPLDVVGGWNKLYGAAGFFQFQCVVPHAPGEVGIRAVLELARSSGAGSFLAVLKEFGEITSPGLLSFPRPGFTLCLDFANRGDSTVKLMRKLERVVVEHGGALYPAKDALMSPEAFAAGFPRLNEFKRFVAAGFSSEFWRRVTEARR
jgi:FAD/FMN-containing dehydrogenase